MKFIFFVFFVLFNSAFSYININPTYFDKRIDYDGSYEEFTLFNPSKETVTYRIYTEPYSKREGLDMSKWVEFYPRSMTLKPGENGKIQVNIASRTKLKQGEYSAVLGVRELPLYKKVREEKSSGIGILTDLKLVLNGYAGDISPKLNFKNLDAVLKNNKISISGIVQNIGKRRGKFELYYDEYFLGNLRIHANEKIDLKKANFLYDGSLKKKPKNLLVVRDYKTKEVVMSVKF
ncbi:MAG: hypothetical protein ACRC4S_06260 [Cetobacterium sp.]